MPIKNEKSQVVLILVSYKDIGNKAKADESDDEEKSSSEMDSDGKVLFCLSQYPFLSSILVITLNNEHVFL